MSFLQKAREAAEKVAAERHGAAPETAGPPANWGQPVAAPGEAVPGEAAPTSHWAQPGAPGEGRVTVAGATEHAKGAFGFAKKGLAGVLEKIDAGTMADIIIRATALQEKTNQALRAKGSPYRIQEISIAAALPPSASFTIGRIDDPESDMSTQELASLSDSTEILAESGESATLEVEGGVIETTT